MFGTSGVRGEYGKKITPSIIYHVASRVVKGNAVVGHDLRDSSQALAFSAASAILAAGYDVEFLGIAPTPMVGFLSEDHGVMITASHNPQNHNGIKVFSGKRELSKEEGNELLLSSVKLENPGRFYFAEEKVEEYIDALLRLFDIPALEVAFDLNSAVQPVFSQILPETELKVHTFNAVPVVVRESLPSAENVPHLLRYEIAFAYDLDGDRVGFFYKGREMKGDALLAGLAKYAQEKFRKGKIVLTVEASLAVREAVGNYVMTKVGSPYVGIKLQEEGIFGGEPAGEFIYPQLSLVPDGIASTMMILEMLACGLTEYFDIPSYPMVRKKFACENKAKAMHYIINNLSLDGDISLEDGIRIDGDDFWVLVRPSGTEDVIRLTAEAKDEKTLRNVVEKAERVIKDAIR